MPGCVTRRVRNGVVAALSAIIGASVVASVAEDRFKLDVPFIPTPQKVVERMLEMAEVKPADFLIDLGSGDGRIAITAARKHGARALGVDIDPDRVEESRQNARRAGVDDKVEFRVQNLFDTDISKANVLTMYLLSSINRKLRPRILNDLAPGSRVVSHVFDLGEWKPDARDVVENRNVYLWIVPARVAGTWTVEHDEGNLVVTIEQSFQEIKGTARLDGRTVPLEDARLNGAEIAFTLALDGGRRREFRGRVSGNTIEGIPVSSKPAPWRALRQRS